MDGFAGESGRSLFKIISAHPMLKVWGKGTRLSSTCWRLKLNMCSSCPSWLTAFWGHSGWLPVPKNLRWAMMMLAAFSSIGIYISIPYPSYGKISCSHIILSTARHCYCTSQKTLLIVMSLWKKNSHLNLFFTPKWNYNVSSWDISPRPKSKNCQLAKISFR